MRCSKCGMPLSPKRSQCPRCGADIPGREAASSPTKRENKQPPFPATAQTWPSSNAGSGWGGANNAPAPIQQEQLPAQAWSSSNTESNWDGANNTSEPVKQEPFPIQADTWSNPNPESSWDGANNAPVPEPGAYAGAAAPHFGSEQAFFPQQNFGELNPAWNNSEQSFSQQPGRMYTPQKSLNLFAPRVGFTIAGTCIAAGTIILLFVFALAKTLPPANTAQTPQTTHTTIAPTPTPEPTAAPSPTPDPTPGGNQQDFSNAQLGSAINDSTAQLVTPTNTFQLHQRIYVTFQVHSGDQVGAACLLWQWGDKSQTKFQFQLEASTGSAYSFMPAEASGAGKVEIYYASTTACSDETLAQTLDFSVS